MWFWRGRVRYGGEGGVLRFREREVARKLAFRVVERVLNFGVSGLNNLLIRD